MQECWAENTDVRLHYLDNGGTNNALPILFIPGLHGRAEDFAAVLEAIPSRRAIAISLRGRGQSGVPDVGYRFEDHLRDINTVIDATGLGAVCLVGHSVGATYALGYALDQPDRVSALVMAGYPARYPELSADWAFRIMRTRPDALPMMAVLGLQHETAELDLWPSLADLHCPLMVMRGGKATSRLPAELATEYQRWSPDAEMRVFEDSGHRLWVPDMARFVDCLEGFLQGESNTIPFELPFHEEEISSQGEGHFKN
jgi:pimeloyl-ACP methyl ester carboxylesterase